MNEFWNINASQNILLAPTSTEILAVKIGHPEVKWGKVMGLNEGLRSFLRHCIIVLSLHELNVNMILDRCLLLTYAAHIPI